MPQKKKHTKPTYKLRRTNMTKPVLYIVAGCSGSGKSWVCKQLTDKFDYVSYDSNRKKHHLDLLLAPGSKPKLYDMPIKISTFIKRHSDQFDIKAVFILETDEAIRTRIEARGGTWTHYLARRNKIMGRRAAKYGVFSGSSRDVLAYLQDIPTLPT